MNEQRFQENRGVTTISQRGGKEPEIYGRRFTPEQEAKKKLVWETLCREIFQRYIPNDGVVLDIGAGDGVFIKNIRARRKFAVDVSPDVHRLEAFGVTPLEMPATDFASHIAEPVDVVFMSNFLEHLPHKQLVLDVLEECHRALAPGGKVMILQPNIRYVGAAYWDYIDHHIALTEHSLVEALEVSGFRIVRLVPRFLPYTIKSKLGLFSGLIGWYLRLPLLWRIFGQQTFVVAERVER
ncbi:MAG: class I SAM-dependent methyltransferase [Bdellovibrionales bacterium]|nr:class I SAM-dependent methyltransferase [Bdellovibrionales bacterium]